MAQIFIFGKSKWLVFIPAISLSDRGLYSADWDIKSQSIHLLLSFCPHYWSLCSTTGQGSSIGCASTWYVYGRGFGPHVWQNILSLRFGHEKISTTILTLPLIQEGQLLAKDCALSTAKLPRRLAQEQCG